MVLDQNKLYYERMASSIGDKARLLPFVKGDKVLEIGFGGGELLDIFAAQGFDVYGLDASPVSESKVAGKEYASNTAEAYADEILDHWAPDTFASVVLSSVMHEVFSYGNRDGKNKHSFDAVSNTLTSIHDSLEVGGRLVIRDGVLAENWDTKIHLTMLNGDSKGVEAYLKLQPFQDRVSLTQVEDNVFLGNLESATSFAYTYTWGEKALARESQELFGLMTRKDYADFIEAHGFRMVHSEEYVQQGYVDALSPKIRFEDENGHAVGFPSTNAIWVAEKV